MQRRIILFLALFFLLPSLVNAIGIAGDVPRTSESILFTPGGEYTFHFKARDDTGRGVHAFLFDDNKGKPGISKFATLSELQQLDERWYYFEVNIKFPDALPEEFVGGRYVMYVYVAEGKQDTQAFGASAIVGNKINFDVLYRYKFIETTFDAKDANINETANMILTVRSLSAVDINKVRAKIDVQDSDGNIIKTFNTEEKKLESNKGISFKEGFDSRGHKPGPYHAYATLYWDANVTYLDDAFRIGELNVRVINYTDKFKKDTIQKFKMLIESEWNNELEGVYGDIYVDGQYQFRTPPINLNPWQSRWVDAFWDNRGYKLGEHNITIELNYKDKDLSGRTKENGVITILEDLESVEVPAKFELSAHLNTTTLLILIILLLVIFNIIYIFKKNKTYKGKEHKHK